MSDGFVWKGGPLEATERWRRARLTARLMVAGRERWLVYEIADASGLFGPSLVFEADMTMRRVRSFPKDWRELTDTTLLALSWGR